MAKAVKKAEKKVMELVTPEVVEVAGGLELSPVKSAIVQLSQEGAVDLIISDYRNELPVTADFIKEQTEKICKVVITSLDQVEEIEFLTNAGSELRSYDKDVKNKRTEIDKPFKAVTSATIKVEKEFLALTKKPLDHIKLQDQAIRQLREEQERIEEEKLRLKTKERVDQLKSIGLETTPLGWSIEFDGEKFEMDLPTLQQMEDSTFLLQLENAKAIVEKYQKDQEEKAEQARIAEEEKQKLIKAKEDSDAKAKEAEARIAQLEAEKKRMQEEQEEKERKAKADVDAERQKFIIEKRTFNLEKLGFNFLNNAGLYDNREFFRVSSFSNLCDSDFDLFYKSQSEKINHYNNFVHKCTVLKNLLDGTGVSISPKEFEEIAYNVKEVDLKIKVDELIEKHNKELAEQKKQMMQARASQIILNDFVFNKDTQSYIFTAEFNNWQKSISFVLTDSDDFQKEFDKVLNSKRDILLERAEVVRKSTLPSPEDVKRIEEYFDALISVYHPDVKHLENFGSELKDLIEKYQKTLY